LQSTIEKDIENKKILDTEQLNKVVSFYAKMEAAKAAESIAESYNTLSKQILLKIKCQVMFNVTLVYLILK
jgi:flagellar motility protein MotE (MotC chaperone)